MTNTATVTPLRWRPKLHLGTRLREVRIQWDDSPTQEAFAARLEVPVGTYTTWENTGRCGDAVGLANRIAKLRPGFDRAWFLDVADDDGGSDLPDQSSPCMADVIDFTARRGQPALPVALDVAA